jgi:hypothetical protein
MANMGEGRPSNTAQIQAVSQSDAAKMPRGRPADKGANLPLLPEVAPVTVAEAAEMLNVSERSVKSARKVHSEGEGDPARW